MCSRKACPRCFKNCHSSWDPIALCTFHSIYCIIIRTSHKIGIEAPQQEDDSHLHGWYLKVARNNFKVHCTHKSSWFNENLMSSAKLINTIEWWKVITLHELASFTRQRCKRNHIFVWLMISCDIIQLSIMNKGSVFLKGRNKLLRSGVFHG